MLKPICKTSTHILHGIAFAILKNSENRATMKITCNMVYVVNLLMFSFLTLLQKSSWEEREVTEEGEKEDDHQSESTELS